MKFKSILITGGTGTFGRTFTRQALRFCERVCIFSRGEHAQAEMRESFTQSDNECLRYFIGDVRDRGRLRRAMEGADLVIHAAALKRIEVGEYNPIEMVRTNVDGAINVIEAATDAGVKRVVALSTDKAWQPISPYGQSKALAESLFLAADHHRGKTGPRFSVVRYGNIAGSAGSVIPKWRALLKAHHTTVPVTDPDCTRFYMRIDEAVDMVMRVAARKEGGELVVPVWLPAYRLGDLAAAMNVRMDVIGLPAHEKKHEGMLDNLTSDKVRRMTVPELKGAINRV